MFSHSNWIELNDNYWTDLNWEQHRLWCTTGGNRIEWMLFNIIIIIQWACIIWLTGFPTMSDHWTYLCCNCTRFLLSRIVFTFGSTKNGSIQIGHMMMRMMVLVAGPRVFWHVPVLSCLVDEWRSSLNEWIPQWQAASFHCLIYILHSIHIEHIAIE